MKHVMACIDASPSAMAVCDYAAWANKRLGSSLTFLHVLDPKQYPTRDDADLSGSIGLDSREQLMDELAALDAKRAKLALERGMLMLAAAKARALASGVEAPATIARHGGLIDTLCELEDDIRLVVMGKRGEASANARDHIGSQLEGVVRAMHRPILVTPRQFKTPRQIMVAFDASATTLKGVSMIASSPLFVGLPVHLVTVGDDIPSLRVSLDQARRLLTDASFEVHTAILPGEVEPTLYAYQSQHSIDLIAMGAYGHSRIRQFFVGATTTRMIQTTPTPLLLLR